MRLPLMQHRRYPHEDPVDGKVAVDADTGCGFNLSVEKVLLCPCPNRRWGVNLCRCRIVFRLWWQVVCLHQVGCHHQGNCQSIRCVQLCSIELRLCVFWGSGFVGECLRGVLLCCKTCGGLCVCIVRQSVVFHRSFFCSRVCCFLFVSQASPGGTPIHNEGCIVCRIQCVKCCFTHWQDQFNDWLVFLNKVHPRGKKRVISWSTSMLGIKNCRGVHGQRAGKHGFDQIRTEIKNLERKLLRTKGSWPKNQGSCTCCTCGPPSHEEGSEGKGNQGDQKVKAKAMKAIKKWKMIQWRRQWRQRPKGDQKVQPATQVDGVSFFVSCSYSTKLESLFCSFFWTSVQ